MASFVMYQKITNAVIINSEPELIKSTADFFKNNPKRRIARVGVWYGKMIKLSRKRYPEEIKKAIQEAVLANDAK